MRRSGWTVGSEREPPPAEGRSADELLGRDILGPDSALRHALLADERREGLRAFLRVTTGESHLVSVTAAPFPHASADKGVCDPRVHYILVLRPAAEDPAASAGPTAFAGLVARSRAMSDIFRLVENLRESDATVLLTGESGTGKEVVARAIHERSARRNGRFVGVNCGALPADLMESELFGHVRGIHRRGEGSRRSFRARGFGHVVSGRGRRSSATSSGQAPASVAGADLRARG